MNSMRIFKMPECPMCKRTLSFRDHWRCYGLNTEAEPYMMIDSKTGVVSCKICDGKWSIESIDHICLCNAVFKGGQYWQDMFMEWSKLKDLEWIKKIKLTKKLLIPKFIRWYNLTPEWDYVRNKFKVKYNDGYWYFETEKEALHFIKLDRSAHNVLW